MPPGGCDLDEFGEIARLFRPLAAGAPEALDLLDDAALLPPSDQELVVTTDTLVEDVHFLPEDPLDLVARKLLRVNLSDLAAKAAEPYGYLLTVAWPPGVEAADRARFARGLADDQARFGMKLFGGDTVRTAGPLTVGATLFGRAPRGATVRRAGARPGDIVLVSGWIGDGGLGLEVLAGRLAPRDDPDGTLVARYRLPEPRLGLRTALRRHAAAAADVSDGLLADAGRIAEASGCAVELALDSLPLSPAAAAWARRADGGAASRLWLAAAGDDYEVVCVARPGDVDALVAAATGSGVALTAVGRMVAGAGVSATFEGAPVRLERLGWAHGIATRDVQT